MKSQLNAQVPRLRDLRQKKAEDPMAFLDGAEGEDGDIPDDLSLAPTDASTSAGTFMTRYTNRSTGTLATNATRKTSKNRRREERKRARGKKGTVYEEEYLVNSIARLIERLNVVGEDVTKLAAGLMRRAMRERAVAVEAAMVEVVVTCERCMVEVFVASEEMSMPSSGGETEGSARPLGGQGVLWEALTASKQKIDMPVLKAFDRLSLLE
jgi:elongator complex protein 1